MRDKKQFEVPLENLRRKCECEDELDFFGKSQEVPQLDAIVGQDRVIKSMQFGLNMTMDGYNIFVVGPVGTGKYQYAKEVVTRVAASRPVPDDWCYIHNFTNMDRPIAVSLPAGRGREFQKDMETVVHEIRNAVRKAYDSSEYELKKAKIYETFQTKMEELYQIIKTRALEEGFAVNSASMKFVFIPLHDGTPFTPEEYYKLPMEERQEINERRQRLWKNLDKVMRDAQNSEKEVTEQIIKLDRETAFLTAQPFVVSLKEKYEKFPLIIQYLDSVHGDISDNNAAFSGPDTGPAPVSNLRPKGEQDEEEDPTVDIASALNPDQGGIFTRYKVNLFINNENQKGAPVIAESNPYYYNLFGKIEYKSQIWATTTDFTMIKPGSVQMANGGYLILQAKDLLTDPFVWDALKKALKYKRAVVENIGEQYRTVPTITLKPEPIPMDVKVILVGSPLFYMIFSSDEDFQKLFKVKVDFDYEIPRNRENLGKYVSFVDSVCKENSLMHFDRTGMAEIIEYGSRMVEDQTKLSTRFDEIRELIHESVALAKMDGAESVSVSYVKDALRERKYRFSKLENKIQEEILNKNLIIDTEGTAVGQINGLFVMQASEYSFGVPARITAITHVGRGGVTHVERETDMSGNIHSKGVLTLTGYLCAKLAQIKPLSFTAQVTFEQVYEGVEGDSASSAELYAILSSLSGVGIKQSFAVTGSVDQMGDIQPIGGVNEKIEGFFDICNAKGLTGEQAVMIPSRNVDNLMLKEEVVEAVRNGKFHIYAIDRVEEGIELLTGVPAGETGEDGNYPQDSVFYLANKKSQDYSKFLEIPTVKTTL
ncbi:AAA family ATPase [Parasporobacterium paucivorans]|uniref:endopeptidase La n=1 Tax=Parasporobacterium paucivorans DSM 15970 TaxID=1122934 RepID=A0A1M6DQH6_9FIRM|nr:AAA family ATPase [Parasporobacterium paucivorans]SHI75462.1 lon-related putative ATP-dependent protease [Parasporobacterium paucivorans DSM 15970]